MVVNANYRKEMIVGNPIKEPCLSVLLKTIGLILAAFTLSACVTTQKTNIENHIGLYEVVDPKCHAAESSTDPCEGILFFELVKGQFIGIGDTDLAYVFWSGDPKIDPELQYTAFLIERGHSARIEGGEFLLNNEDGAEEYLRLSNGKLVSYHAKYASGRSVQYNLKPVARGNLLHVRLNYPGNQ